MVHTLQRWPSAQSPGFQARFFACLPPVPQEGSPFGISRHTQGSLRCVGLYSLPSQYLSGLGRPRE